MIMALFMMVVLTGIGTVMFNVATSNQQDSGRDRLAGGALGVAEAGIAHALAYMRSNGIASLTCDGANPASALCSNDWGYNYLSAASGGHAVTLTDGGQYKVWIQKIQAYSPSAGANQGRYKITSVGTLGNGPASRTVTTEVTAKPFPFPVGIYADDYVRDEGTISISKLSLFSKGCIGKRSHITFDTSVNDLANPSLVPGAHSALYISASNITGLDDANCNAGENKNIHRPLPAGAGFCHSSYRFDSDALGGSLTATLCDPAVNGGRGLPSPPGSKFDVNSLAAYGYSVPRGLPDSQYALLKQKAQADGTYYDCVAGTPAGACSGGNLNGVTLSGATNPNAVLYAKLAPGKTFTVPSTVTGYNAAFCGTRSLMIIVEGGDMDLNSNTDMVAAMFVPDGAVHANGTATVIGSLFAKQLFMNGNINFTLAQCFFDNFPAGALNVSPFNFQEVDR